MQTHQERLSQQRAAVEAMSERLAGAQAQVSRTEELVEISQAKKQDLVAVQHKAKEASSLEKVERGKLAEMELADPQLEVLNAQTQIEVMKARLDQARDALDECQLKDPASRPGAACPGRARRHRGRLGPAVGHPVRLRPAAPGAR